MALSIFVTAEITDKPCLIPIIPPLRLWELDKAFFMPVVFFVSCAWEELRGNRLAAPSESRRQGASCKQYGEGVKPDRHGLIEKNGTVPANPGQVCGKPIYGFLSGLSAMIGGDARTPPRHRLWVLKSGKRVQSIYEGTRPMKRLARPIAEW